MRLNKTFFVAAVAFFAVSAAGAADKPAAKKSAAEIEKEKALANPYTNDLGPAQIDDQVKEYPADKKEGYKLLLKRCAQCHTPARPLNSRFVELEGKDDAAQNAAIASLKKSHPDVFKDESIWKIEAKLWNRYVKRMLNKPGCGKEQGGEMTKAEAKKIYEFLVYDSQKRKLGDNAAKWAEHRKKLIEELKAKNPARYKELAEKKEL